MNELWINKKRYFCKGSFDELTQNEFIEIAWAMNFEESKANLMILYSLLKMGQVQRSFLRRTITKLDLDNFSELLRLTNFVRKLKIEKNPFANFKSLQSPSYLHDFSFGHYINMDTYFLKYQNSKKVQHLDNLLSIFFGSQNLDEKIIKKVQKFSDKEKNAVLVCFLAFRTMLVTTFPKVFEGSSSGKKATWGQVLRRVAGNVIQMKDVSELPATQVFFDISETIKDYQEQEAQLNAQK